MATKKTAKKKKKTPIKKIRRRRKRGKGGTKLYFTKDTQVAIGEFTATDPTDLQMRELIWRTRIMPAFSKLVENLINIYGFKGMDPYDVMKSDCVTFLFETMKKFDHSMGTNAFSYFNVVAKNWLIIRSKARVKKLKTTVSMTNVVNSSQADTREYMSNKDHDTLARHQVVESPEVVMEQREALESIFGGLREIRTRLKNENELLCIDSIITIFENVEELDLLNKSAILLYIKEISGLSQKQLTTSLHTIKKHYREIKKNDFELF